MIRTSTTKHRKLLNRDMSIHIRIKIVIMTIDITKTAVSNCIIVNLLLVDHSCIVLW
jgi:hypothetical protein